MKAKTLIVMAACMAIGLCASGCQNSMTQTAVAQEDARQGRPKIQGTL